MSAISQALNAGHSVQDILRYLSQHNPQLARQVSAALNAGHSIDHVLNFIEKNGNRMGNLIPAKKQMNRSDNLYKTAQTSIHPSLTGAARFAGGVAGLAGGAYALSRAMPSILQRIQPGNTGITPNVPVPPSPPSPTSPQATNGIGGIQSSNIPQPPNVPSPQQPPITPVNVAPNVAQPPVTPQPQGVSTNLQPIFEKYKGLTDTIDKLRDKNDVTAIVAYLNKFGPAQVKKIEKEAGQPIEKVIEEYLKANPQPVAQAEAPKAEAEAKPIEKGSTVATPAGVGEVKEIRGNKALVEVDGKKHKFDKDELTPTDSTMPGFVPSEEDLFEHARDPFLGINMPGYKPKHLTHEEYLKSQENLKESEKARKKTAMRKQMEAKEKKERTEKFEKEMGPILKEHRERESERRKKELESIKGFSMEELDQLVDNGLEDAAHEIEQGIAKGQQYFTHTGQEWKAVGQSDVTEEGKEEYPTRGKAKGLSFQEVIEKYLPVQALFQRYKFLDPKISSDRFMKRLEKSIIDLLTPKES